MSFALRNEAVLGLVVSKACPSLDTALLSR